MKKISSLLRKCKSLSRTLGRSSSYSSLRSKSTREDLWVGRRSMEDDDQNENIINGSGSGSGSNVIIYVGSTRKRYVISSKYLSHPVLNALIDKSKQQQNHAQAAATAVAVAAAAASDQRDVISVRCEVVLFDHLLWMLENSEPNIAFDESNFEELAELYVF